jgi:murein DD-endopeptidase MepM/ murein hydrolase activator NlpD
MSAFHPKPRLSVALLLATLLAGSAPVMAEAMRALPDADRKSDIGIHTDDWVWPFDPSPPVVRGFDPPTSPWDAAHRGVDLGGSITQPVRTIGAGIVAFAGVIAGRGVVVVDHGGLRSTYEPVTAMVGTGSAVSTGQVIGLLQGVGSHCAPAPCLHLGVKRARDYIDPLDLLGALVVRLKPDDGSPADAWPPTWDSSTGWVQARGCAC